LLNKMQSLFLWQVKVQEGVMFEIQTLVSKNKVLCFKVRLLCQGQHVKEIKHILTLSHLDHCRTRTKMYSKTQICKADEVTGCEVA